MHERYSLSDTSHLAERLGASLPFKTAPSYEAVPGMELPVGLKGEVSLMKWGIRPEWAVRKGSPFMKIMQPREEMMVEIMKNRQRQTKVHYKRCVVPVTSFYESAKEEGGEPVRHDAPAGTIYGLAGIYESWTNEKGEPQDSFAIITVKRHRRDSPIVLNPKAEPIWLDPTFKDWNVLGSILQIPKDAKPYA